MATETSDMVVSKVVKAAVRMVPLDNLNVDTSYQRDVKRGHKGIVADFKEEALGVPLVAQREDGGLWIVDGLQRITALRKLNWKTVKAEVFASRGPEHEADVFRLVNMGRTKLTTAEAFRAMLTAGDKLAWAIKEAVEKCGGRLHLGGGVEFDQSGAKAKYVSCISALLRYAKVHGTAPISFALSTAYECWPDDRAGVNVRMVGGLCCFWVQHEGEVDIARLWPRLKSVSAQKVLYSAAQSSLAGNVDFHVAKSLEEVYRKRMSKRAGS